MEGKAKMFFSLFPKNSLKPTRKRGACLENLLRKNIPKMG
jgi:hypothetical protein